MSTTQYYRPDQQFANQQPTTQYYRPDQQFTNQQPTTQYYRPDQQFANQQPTGQQPGGPSWFRIWAVTIGTAVAVVFIALAVTVWHGHSSPTPATHGTSSSTVVPAHPTTPVVPPAQPTAPPTHSAGGGAGN